MICWKDMTFCTRHSCTRKECRRHPDKWEEWRKSNDENRLPISVSDFKSCKLYRGDEDEERRED